MLTLAQQFAEQVGAELELLGHSWARADAIYAEAFGDHRPARSTVQVAALPAGALVEIEAWAYRPESSSEK